MQLSQSLRRTSPSSYPLLTRCCDETQAFPLPFSASRRGGASRGVSESRGVDSPGSQVCAWVDGASLRRGGKFELLILADIRGLSLRARAAWARPSTGAGARRDCCRALALPTAPAAPEGVVSYTPRSGHAPRSASTSACKSSEGTCSGQTGAEDSLESAGYG